MTTVWSATPTSISRPHSLVSFCFHQDVIFPIEPPTFQLIWLVSSSPSLWCTSTNTLSPLCSTLYLPVSVGFNLYLLPCRFYLVSCTLHLVDSTLYLPALLDFLALSFFIVSFQGSPSSWPWWGGTSSPCSSMRIIPTLRRRRPIKSLPAHRQCHPQENPCFETKCDNLLS